MKRKNILSIFLLTGLLTLCLTLDPFRNLFLTGRALGGVSKKAVEEEYGEALKLFNQSLSLIHDNYVNPEKVKVEDLIYGAIEGMIKKLE
jgi:C-terminal processing protease CtpA/Prc